MGIGRTNIIVCGSSGGGGGSGYDGTIDLPDNIGSIKVSAFGGTAKVEITYADPGKALLNGVHIAYKKGGYPASPSDGEHIRILTESTTAQITGLENEERYYFRAYPYRTIDGKDYYQTCEPGKSKTECIVVASDWVNRMIADDQGQNSDMVRIPKMSWKDLGVGESTETFPAFIVDGKEVDALYFGKYEASEKNSRAYSTKGEKPKVSIDFDAASKLCTDKGAGWHLTTRLEWAAVELWCLKNGYQPLGNNDYGKDTTESTYSTPNGQKSGSEAIATGAGPKTWAHNNSDDGIWDLNGNVYEWQTGMRLYKGELQVISKDGVTFCNDAAILPSSSDSQYWYCINGSTGALMKPNGSGTTSGSVRCGSNSTWTTGSASGTSSGKFFNTSAGSGVGQKAKEMLQALCLIKPDTLTADNGDYFYTSTSNEILARAGGYWSNGAGAGVCYLNFSNSRAGTDAYLGFRPAFVELGTDG